MDFPRFNREEDPTSWSYRASQFFDYHQTPKEERIPLASWNLEGEEDVVLAWPQAVLDRRTRKRCEDVLIHWKGLAPSDVVWKKAEVKNKRFPEFTLQEEGMPLVTQLLNGDKYATWSQAVIMALEAKHKLGFIDKTIKEPAVDSAKLSSWTRYNSMVLLGLFIP
ncbi:hypothetical protein RJ639_002118 [Escallonia herrerae]|uniref:Retrotransposon Copia-like N-terminal domain-containing protein n=1 Tax=Escallonia herrerae TaxID=1293975 RepID=A0AA88XBY2_9ASTE|nr:hypothetical protein RJ639_002118 [Escallonia herrerae]